MEDLGHARASWLRDRPGFDRFSGYLVERLTALTRRLGIVSVISARTKEIDSVIKKLILKPSYTYAGLGDKVGARVIVKRLRDVSAVSQCVQEYFECGTFENTADRLADDPLGYLSVHVDISLPSNDPRHEEFPARAFRAELQIRTLAQNVWSEMAHDTTYKSGGTVEHTMKRRLHLLAALIEVADNDYQRLEDEISTLSGMPEISVLRGLERQYFKLSSRPGDVELSLRVIRLLWPLYGKTPEQLSDHFEKVVTQHEGELSTIFSESEMISAERSAFIFQPEILMIYDQLLSMQYRLRTKWAQEFPVEELERVALRFGISFA